MSVRSGSEGERDCIVVGAGLAGLSCAHGLVSSGRSVHVVEAGPQVGGRARTEWHRGRPVDRGFQVLFRAYPQTRRLIRAVGLPRRDLRPFLGGAVFIDGGSRHQLRWGPTALAGFTGLSAGDRLRLARLGAEVVARPADDLLGGDAGETTEGFLFRRGFSEEALEHFFRPFFGVVFYDRSLRADAGYFRFLMAMLGRGPAVLPSDGLGMISEWTAAAVRQAGGTVELGAPAAALEPDATGARVAAVRLEDGRRLRARQVVLAVEAPVSARLLAALDPATAGRMPADAASAVTVAFALRRSLYRGRTILVNAARDDGRPRVDLICQTTNATRPGAPEGPHIVLATRVLTGGASPEGLAEATERTVREWAPGFPWSRTAEPIGEFRHPFAQFRPLPGVRAELPGPRTGLENLILAGDLTHHPSIEGAVASGARAAGVADALIP